MGATAAALAGRVRTIDGGTPGRWRFLEAAGKGQRQRVEGRAAAWSNSNRQPQARKA